MHKIHKEILVHSYVMSVIVNRCIKSDRHPAEVRFSRDNHAHRPIYTGHQDVTLCDLDGLQQVGRMCILDLSYLLLVSNGWFCSVIKPAPDRKTYTPSC